MKEDLIIKYLVGEAEPHEVYIIEEWRKLDVNNEKQFQTIKTIWDESYHLKNEDDFNADNAWNSVKKLIINKPQSKVVNFNFRWMAAASVLILLGIVFWFFNQSEKEVYSAAFHNSQNDIQKIALQDGSKVTLKNGSFKYSTSRFSSKRQIQMDSGTAFFDVAPNKSQPFEIKSNNVTITVVGTSFEVISNQNFTSVKVIEGIVVFTTPVGKQTLTAGMGAKYNYQTAALSGMEVNNKNKMAYHTGVLDFSNKSLKEVVEDLNQYQTNYTIQIANADVNNCLITTSFKNEKIEDILKVITTTLQLTYRKDEEKKLITIEGAYCK